LKLAFLELPMKERTLEGFGDRLAEIRQSRCLTQAELAQAVGVSRRVIAYYEHEDAQPPGAMLVDLAKALRVSTDELLGLKLPKEKRSPRTARLLKRLQKVEQLPTTDQRVVLKLVDGLLERQGRSNGRS
jgi:transcriptional regulator with XRE-family HTH domain